MCRNASWRCLDCNLEKTLKIACQEKSPWCSYNCQTLRWIDQKLNKNMQARPQCNLPVTWWRHWIDHEERELVVEQHRHTLYNCSTDITNQLYYLANMWPSISNRDFQADQSCFPNSNSLITISGEKEMWVEIIFFPLQQADRNRVKIIYWTSHFTLFTTPVKLLEKNC